AQGLLQAIWTDERFSASCVTLRNTEQIHENADAARRFEPLTLTEIEELRDAVLASNPTMCPGCDGRCSLAAGTRARLPRAAPAQQALSCAPPARGPAAAAAAADAASPRRGRRGAPRARPAPPGGAGESRPRPGPPGRALDGRRPRRRPRGVPPQDRLRRAA